MKTLTGVIALMLALLFGASNVVDAADAPAAKKDPVTEACIGKKLGDMVKVGGKNVKCEQRHIAVSDSGVGNPKPIVVPIKK